ncbi:MAG: hypothetical protein IJV16_08980, partial [Lachnospiraceae bacterium]|nr:hypothetical protein [Lachnospiraceae bacterium]
MAVLELELAWLPVSALEDELEDDVLLVLPVLFPLAELLELVEFPLTLDELDDEPLELVVLELLVVLDEP